MGNAEGGTVFIKNNHFIHSFLGALQQMRFSLYQSHVHVCVEIGKCWEQSVGALSYMV